MARTAKDTTSSAPLLESVTPFVWTAPDGSERAVRIGEVVRSDDPVVHANPGWFVPKDTPHAERPHWRDFVKPS